MKVFVKYFFMTFLLFTMVFTGSMWAYDTVFEEIPTNPNDEGKLIDSNGLEGLYPDAEPGSIEYSFAHSNKVNVLLLGMEGSRTDTIMLASYDRDNKEIDLISIPRDTYYPRVGHNSAGKKKINAIYYDDGIKGCQKAVSDLLYGMPIQYYVEIDYNGVEEIVDSLGGVPIYVPLNMKYDDPYDKPPLHINIKKGQQTLSGKKAVQFLRFRQNNNGTGYRDGDIGRIKAQQDFMKAAFEKTLSLRLPKVAGTAAKYVKTDINIKELISIAVSALGMSLSDLSTHSLPGEADNFEGLSYWYPNKEETAAIVDGIYNMKEESAKQEESEQE